MTLEEFIKKDNHTLQPARVYNEDYAGASSSFVREDIAEGYAQSQVNEAVEKTLILFELFTEDRITNSELIDELKKLKR